MKIADTSFKIKYTEGTKTPFLSILKGKPDTKYPMRKQIDKVI